MNVLSFSIFPYPLFIKGGLATFQPGAKHFRRIFTVFDLIYVKKGTMYITEDNEQFCISEGQYILLVPGLDHYGHDTHTEETDFYWIHFDMDQSYELLEKEELDWSDIFIKDATFTSPAEFQLYIPRYRQIVNRGQLEHLLEKIVEQHESNHPMERLQQQSTFEQIWSLLQQEAFEITTTSEKIALQVVEYIHGHYHKPIRITDIAHELLFHPDYLTRVMKKTKGRTPIEYLNYYRILQAKHLLASSEEKIISIARSVGIQDPTYFSRLFKKYEGMTPKQYRQLVYRSY